MTKPLHVALCWHSLNHANLGVDALTRSNIAIVQAAAARAGRTVRFTTLCSTPYPGDAPEGVTVGPRAELKPLFTGRSPVHAVIRDADLVIDIGEGDSWADIYDGRRFLRQAGSKIAALVHRKPLVLSPQTIGPFNARWRRIAANAIMSRARAVYARDHMSKAYLDEHRIASETGEFIDVAFRLPFDRRSRATDRRRVGLNISGLLYRGGYTGRNEFGLTLDYADLSHRLIDALTAMSDVEIHLLPHVIGKSGESDLAIVPELMARYPDLILPETFRTASEAKTYMSGLDFVVGGRMHACIGSFSALTPVVPIAYSRKFNGLFGTLGYAHLVDGKADTTDAALEKILNGFASRDVLAADVQRGMTIAKERLDAYEDRLVKILSEL